MVQAVPLTLAERLVRANDCMERITAKCAAGYRFTKPVGDFISDMRITLRGPNPRITIGQLKWMEKIERLYLKVPKEVKRGR